LQAVLELSQPKISRHLKTLRDEGLVQGRREGLWIHYSLHPQLPQWSLKILAELRRGIMQQEPYVSAARKVKKNLSKKACKS
jgi:ArsR family transcriptional regulator